MRLMLDTTFVIDHLRGDEAALSTYARLAEESDQIYVCDVVVCEAWAGTHDPADPRVERFLRYLEFVQPGPDSARKAGTWRSDALRRGRSLSAADALIAAAAASLDAAVLTRNVRDFELTPVRVETY